MELGEGFAVVALDAAEGVAVEGGDVGGRAGEEGGVGRNVVAVHHAEFFGELRGPIGAVVLEGVVELAADEAAREFVRGEGLVECGEVAAQGVGRVGIEDEAFAAGGGALYELFGGLGDELAGGVEDGFLGGVGGRNPWAAEGPAGAGGHIDAEAETLGFAAGVREHLNPLRREEIDVTVLIALRAVDGGDFDATEAGGGELFELARETGLVDAAAGPPPAGPGFVFFGELGPAEGFGGCRRLREGGKGEKERRGNQGEGRAKRTHKPRKLLAPAAATTKERAGQFVREVNFTQGVSVREGTARRAAGWRRTLSKRWLRRRPWRARRGRDRRRGRG